jgi:hypothetical protein
MKRISFVLVETMIATLLSYSASAIAPNFSKTANPSSGPAPLTVVYTYTFDNTQGPQPLASVSKPSDDKCSPVVFSGGDSNQNQILDVGEIWTWNCSAVINATTVNTSQTSASYTICSGNTCSTTYLDFITAHATVTIIPAPLSVSITGPRTACKNDVVNLTAIAAGGTPPYTFAWTNSATSQTITPNTSVPGTFPFGVTVTDHSGATASANTTLVVAFKCLTEINRVNKPPEFPLSTTIEWGCGWRFAGRCLYPTIVKICIGGQCFDNPAVPGPPICKVCVVLMGVGGGFILGLGAGLLLQKMRGRNIEPRT